MKLCENVTELIGDTPVVRLSKFIPEDAKRCVCETRNV